VKDKKQYVVFDENNGSTIVFAENEEKAIDAYYDAIDSMISHYERRCTCYNPKAIPLDRDKVLKPLRVELLD